MKSNECTRSCYVCVWVVQLKTRRHAGDDELIKKSDKKCVSTLLPLYESSRNDGKDTFTVKESVQIFVRHSCETVWLLLSGLLHVGHRPLINKKKKELFFTCWYKIWNKFFLQVLFLLHVIFVMQTTCSFVFVTGWWWHVWWLWSSHDVTWFRAGK